VTTSTECPKCHISFVGKEIPIGLIEGNPGYYKTMEEAVEAAKSYGWTPENKRWFSNHYVYIKEWNEDYTIKYRYHGCRACGYRWGENMPPHVRKEHG